MVTISTKDARRSDFMITFRIFVKEALLDNEIVVMKTKFYIQVSSVMLEIDLFFIRYIYINVQRLIQDLQDYLLTMVLLLANKTYPLPRSM